MKVKGWERLLPLFVAALFVGCAVGPKYQRPPVDTPHAYRFDSTLGTNSFGDLPWWEVFRDPALARPHSDGVDE